MPTEVTSAPHQQSLVEALVGLNTGDVETLRDALTKSYIAAAREFCENRMTKVEYYARIDKINDVRVKLANLYDLVKGAS